VIKITVYILTFFFSAQLLADELVYFPFNEDLGAVAVDYSGNNSVGVFSDDLNLVSNEFGQQGYTAHFNQKNDRIDLDGFSVVGNQLSISLWFKATEFVNKNNDGRLISKASSTSSNDHIIMLSTIRVGTETRLRARLKTDGRAKTRTMVAVSGDIHLDTWHHVAFIYDGGSAKLVLDGVVVGSYAIAGDILNDLNIFTAIGNQPSGAGQRPFTGFIDEIRIFDHALTDDELQELSSNAGSVLAESDTDISNESQLEDSNQSTLGSAVPSNTSDVIDGVGADNNSIDFAVTEEPAPEIELENTDSANVEESVPSLSFQVQNLSLPLNSDASAVDGILGVSKTTLLANIDSSGNEDLRNGSFAFPGATGYGRHSVGGRGGRVVCVNTLKDVNKKNDGFISYREAISGINEAAFSPRIVTFCVSGEINTGIEDPVNILRGKLTVACQTAPSPGVVITGFRPISLSTDVDDIVWRHCDVKIRDTFSPSKNQVNRGVAIGGSTRGAPSRVIFDHMSIMWSTDDSFTVYVNRSVNKVTPDNITLMHSIVGEGDTTCLRGDNECGNASSRQNRDYSFPNHSTGPAISSLNGKQIQGISLIANVFGNTVSRNPQIRGAYGEVANNLIFNMYSDGTRASASAGKETTNDLYLENNIYKEGPDTRKTSDPLIYKDGNYVVKENTFVLRDGSKLDNYRSNRKRRLVKARQYTSGDSALNLSCVGASQPHRDKADRRIVSEANGAGVAPVLSSAEIGIGPRVPPIVGPCTPGKLCFYEGTVNDQGQRDYSEYLQSRFHPRNYDTDKDGIADSWERSIIDSDKSDNLRSLSDIDTTTNADSDGYYDVEEWINSLAVCRS